MTSLNRIKKLKMERRAKRKLKLKRLKQKPPEPVVPPKRWRGVIIIGKGGRATVATKSKDGNMMPLEKLQALMDREFTSEAPHRVFQAIERKREPVK